MKLLKLQTDLTSYTYPIVKIFVCLLVITFSIVRNQIFCFSSVWTNTVVTVLCFALAIPSILCLYISIGELFHTHSNRRDIKYQQSDIRQLEIETVTKIVTDNDIVEIEVISNNKIIKIGASSECQYSSSVFKNKLFYISSSEYDTIEMFQETLIDLFPERDVPVLKIDGIPIRQYTV